MILHYPRRGPPSSAPHRTCSVEAMIQVGAAWIHHSLHRAKLGGGGFSVGCRRGSAESSSHRAKLGGDARKWAPRNSRRYSRYSAFSGSLEAASEAPSVLVQQGPHRRVLRRARPLVESVRRPKPTPNTFFPAEGGYGPARPLLGGVSQSLARPSGARRRRQEPGTVWEMRAVGLAAGEQWLADRMMEGNLKKVDRARALGASMGETCSRRG